jgi:hypothetical protein
LEIAKQLLLVVCLLLYYFLKALDMYKAAQKVKPGSKDVADKVRALTRAVNGSKGGGNSTKDTAKGTSTFKFSKQQSSSESPEKQRATAAPQKQQQLAGGSDQQQQQQQQEEQQQELPPAAAEFQQFLLEYAQQMVSEEGLEFQPEVHFLPGAPSSLPQSPPSCFAPSSEAPCVATNAALRPCWVRT